MFEESYAEVVLTIKKDGRTLEYRFDKVAGPVDVRPVWEEPEGIEIVTDMIIRGADRVKSFQIDFRPLPDENGHWGTMRKVDTD
jgi:hypothetical protein